MTLRAFPIALVALLAAALLAVALGSVEQSRVAAIQLDESTDVSRGTQRGA